MKNVWLIPLICLMPFEVFSYQEANPEQRATAFTHVTVINVTGAPAKSNMTVVVKGDRIESLGKTDQLTVPSDTRVMDATGKFLIPGLWDMHVHPWWGKRFLPLFTANGVTGIRVMWGEPEHHKWRMEISAGQLIGPRMVIASPILDGPDTPGGMTIVRNAEEGRKIVRKCMEDGADLIKVYNGLPRDAYFAIADEAKKQGIPFVGHVPKRVSAVEASDAGQKSIEHTWSVIKGYSYAEVQDMKEFMKAQSTRGNGKATTEILSEKHVPELFTLFAHFVKNGTAVCPTLIIDNNVFLSREEGGFANDPRFEHIPVHARNGWNDSYAKTTGKGRADLKKTLEGGSYLVDAMRLAGVTLLAGTDATYQNGFYGYGLHDELALLVKAGLSPMEALKAATYNPAKVLGKLDSMGTVEQGKIADLVLLDADPLEDIRNTQRIAAVVSGGRVFDKAALDQMLAQVKASRLHDAAASSENPIENVKKLLTEGADVNARDQQGWTVAQAALYGLKFKVIDLLLENGADTKDPYMVAYTGDLAGIRKLLDKNGVVDNLDGMTLLHAAAAGGNEDIVEFLIARGFDVTATTQHDTQPLHYAVSKDSLGVAEVLLANGATADSGKLTPLVLAAIIGHKDMVEFLISKGADFNKGPRTLLHITAEWSLPLDIAKLLLEVGADVNAKDEDGNTPLHLSKGRLEMAELLLSKGADVNAKNNLGNSPFSIAEDLGAKDTIRLFRKYRAKE